MTLPRTPPTAASALADHVVAATLFLTLFAAQAAVIAMSPVLVAAAADLGVSTAAAGQLRTVVGVAATATALVLAAAGGRVTLRAQLTGACLLLVAGAAASALAPGFALLVIAQVPIGVAIAVLNTAGTLAAADWVAPERRTRVLGVALVGPPAAWIIGMPLVGRVADDDWRLAWIVLPLAAAVVTLPLVARRRAAARPQRDAVDPRAALADPAVARFLGADLFANAAWAGTLVYAGALFVEAYGTGTDETGVLLALAACGYVVGTLGSRRLATRPGSTVAVALPAALAVADLAFFALRADLGATVAAFTVTAVLAGARTFVASAAAISSPPHLRTAITSMRSATMQVGYIVGTLAGGGAIAAGGYDAMGLAMAGLFAGAAALAAGPRTRRAGGVAPAVR